ncbi:sensor histidine kinase [Parapedobacter deserti]|uniref:Sensor histidine kinase n=1 Tax=Parapedobacter deserti TaxID=1912957 RepID=A0ABV7JGV7_9SPHI
MRIRFPLKELIRYSLVLSLSIMVFVAIMTYSQELDLLSGISRATLSGAVLLVTCAVSILLIVLFEKRNFTDSARHTHLRLFLGSLINVLFMFGYHFFRLWAEKYGLIPSALYVSEEMQVLEGWQLYLLIIIPALMVYGLVHLLHNFILLNHLKTQTELEVSHLRSVNAETTNQLLRQQVQPHFLFNALTVLKSLIRKDGKTAEAYLLRLSDFLRISFSQNKKGIATVREEVKLCRDYLEMQKMRFGDALEYTFDVPDSYQDGILPFFSLQPLAENAVKHNELTDERPLHIRITVHDGVIKVENNLQRKASVEGSTGNGLSNLSERYKLLSGNNIHIVDDGVSFSVAFNIIPV